MYTGGCAKIQEETLLIEIDHRQPLCVRLLSQLINKWEVTLISYDISR